MKKVLQKIANILTLNVYNTENAGLFEGKMGIMLFFYNYARFTDNKLYMDIADDLFNSVYDSLNKTRNTSFDQGVTGIAWGTRYLIRNNFVDGDPEDVLLEIENMLLKDYINDFQSQIPLSTIGLYVHSIIIDGANSDKLNKLINIILHKYEFHFLCLSITPKPITYINSALFVLSLLEKKVEFRLRAERVIFKILLYVSNLGTLSKIEKNDLKTLNKILLAINLSSKEKYTILEKIAKYNDLDCIHMEKLKNYLWQNFIYFPNEYILINFNDVNTFIDKNYTFLPKENSLSIYNGLAGLGLILIKNLHSEVLTLPNLNK